MSANRGGDRSNSRGDSTPSVFHQPWWKSDGAGCVRTLYPAVAAPACFSRRALSSIALLARNARLRPRPFHAGRLSAVASATVEWTRDGERLPSRVARSTRRLIPRSMVGCTMRSATRKNGQKGTERSMGPDRYRSRTMRRVLPVGCIYSDHAVHLPIWPIAGRVPGRSDEPFRDPRCPRPRPSRRRRPESLRLKSRLIVPGMDAGIPAATLRGRGLTSRLNWRGSQGTADREDAQVSTVI
jgi:hypothetical protein